MFRLDCVTVTVGSSSITGWLDLPKFLDGGFGRGDGDRDTVALKLDAWINMSWLTKSGNGNAFRSMNKSSKRHCSRACVGRQAISRNNVINQARFFFLRPA